MPLGQAAELAPDSGKVLANLALLLLVEGEPVRAKNVMDRAQLSDEARGQVLRLASEIRSQTAAPMAAAPAGGGTVAGADTQATRVSRGEGIVMPVMSPLMDRLGNGPIMR